jgi:2-methylcitrate dehydratase PrpD
MSKPADAATGPSASEALGAFIAATTWEDLDDAVRHQAKRSLLNFVGCALGAADEAPVAAAVRVLARLSGPPQATLIGRVERFDILNAAFVNAIAGNLLDFDDTHLATVIHPTAPVAPAVLALAESRGGSGSELLAALAVGMEVECRIGNAVSPAHYARGWHITATCGVFGATAAAAKLIGLSPAQTAHALGIAASEAAGLVENLTTAAKNVGVGNASRNGVLAALMTEAGYEAAPRAIEGPLGWARASGDRPDMALMLDGLGQRWELLDNAFKPYPSGVVLHAVIDACLELRATHGLDAAAIENVTVTGDALLLARGDRVVRNERDARVSIQHSAAVAFLFGAAGLAEHSPEATDDPRVRAFRAIVSPHLDPAMPKGAARVEVRLKDGRTLAATVVDARGSLKKPMSDAEIEAKVRTLAGTGRVASRVDAIIDRIWRLDDLADADALTALLSAGND